MDMKVIGSSFNKCATCEYYCGNRYPSGHWVKYEGGEGLCGRPPFLNPYKTDADSGCSYWKKWGALR